MRLRYRLLLAVTDFLLVSASLVLALALRLDFDPAGMERYLADLWLYPAVAGFTVLVFYLFGLYEKVWRYAGLNELVSMVGAATLALAPFQIMVLWGRGAFFPRTAPVLAWLLVISLCGGVRFLLRLVSERRGRPAAGKRVLVVGANDAGEAIVRELARHPERSLSPVGFLDDDPDRRGIKIHGVPVLGPVGGLAEVAAAHRIAEVIVAQPEPARLRQLMATCKEQGLELRVVPGLSEVATGRALVTQMREVQIEDLLEREPVSADLGGIASYLAGRRVLVTGAGGSIGSEICRQVARCSQEPLILVGRGENSIYEIALELRGHPVVPFIADVRDRARMEECFRTHRPQVVFHAAAHKHVPLMETNIPEAVTNNVFGTLLLMEMCQKYGVQKFILLSTDKAVNPTSVMGATKRLSELILARRADPGFAAVRFGNVLASRGSVIPTFKRQIAQGGPVTVTHPEMTRYFMTIPEAVLLVLQAGAMARGGEIYILDMGRPVKILDLARNMIRLSGFEPERDIPIEITGLRPGEKLTEQLVNTGEETTATEFPKILRVTSPPPDPAWPGRDLEALRAAAEASDGPACIELLRRLVANYQPQGVEEAQVF